MTDKVTLWHLKGVDEKGKALPPYAVELWPVDATEAIAKDPEGWSRTQPEDDDDPAPRKAKRVKEPEPDA